MNPSSEPENQLDNDKEELQEKTWELLLEVMSQGERHQLNSDILTPYHTQLLSLILESQEHHTQSKLKAFAGELEQKAIDEERVIFGNTEYIKKIPLESLKAIKEKYQL